MANRDPHICFISPNAYPLLSGDEDTAVIGGAELQVVIVARLLAARGRSVSMICLDFGQQDRVEIDGIRVFRAFRPNRGIPALRFIHPRLTSIWKCLGHADADIYYQQTAGMLTGVMAAFCRRHGKKSVFASASNPDLVPNTPRIKYARDRWVYSYGLRNVDRIFVQNAEQARLCRLHFRREPILVRNCYPIPARTFSDSGGNCILWVSTIRKLKRPDLFLDLAQALPNLSFVMIGGPGDGESALFESIRNRAGKIQNLQYLGFLSFTRAEEHFDRAALFVNTSESEGFPNTFLQAWGRGTPTISFVDAGARINSEPVGLRVKSFDEMVSTVAVLASDRAARVMEGQRCRSYVESTHSPEKIIDLYEQIFDDLVMPRSLPAMRPNDETISDVTSEIER